MPTVRDTESTKAAPKPAADAPRRRSAKDLQVKETIATIYSMVGGLMQTIGAPKTKSDGSVADPDGGIQGTGMYLVGYAEDVAEQWMELADTNPRIKRTLYKLAEGGATVPLLMTHVAILSPFLASRGIVPPTVPAMFMPESVMKMQAQAEEQARQETPPNPHL